jgi:cold shock CspA family protein
MAMGKVIGWSPVQGYGLIQRLDGPMVGETYFCKIEGVPNYQTGQRVHFRPTIDHRGRNMAADLSVMRVTK